MISIMKKILVLTCIAYALSAPATAQMKTQAQKLFEQYQAKERSFDPTVANLYCDSAVIQNTRTYPTGEQRSLSFPAPKYKALIEAAMPLAKAKGDYSTYSKVRFSQESGGTRISADRYSVLKKYTSPISILVGSCNGKPAILEELSNSQP